MKERLSITVDMDLANKIKKISAEENIPQSRILVEAFKLWEQERISTLMRKGYIETSDEDLSLAEFDLAAGNEVEV